MLMDLICSWYTTTSIFTGFEDNTMDASYIPGEKVDFLADSLLFLLCPFMINTRKMMSRIARLESGLEATT